MKILIAPDSFKGSIDAIEAANAIHRGIAKWNPNVACVVQPMADGGEGTLQVLDEVLELKTVEVIVCDPLFRPIKCTFKTIEKTAFIEMSQASGYALLTSKERNCLLTTTYGTGELIRDALNAGMKEIYLFIGGSATCDGGIGMARALGYQLKNKNGKEIVPVGKNLVKLKHIDTKQLRFNPKEIVIHVVCDVKNKLYGKKGAAYVYGPQKGADKKGVERLDAGLKNLSQVVSKDLNQKISEIKGGGAAGGLGAGAFAFLKANILSGFDTIAEILQLEQKIEKADWIITGEGKVDKQSSKGKVVYGISKLAKKYEVPVIVFSGVNELKEKELHRLGIKESYTIRKVARNNKDAMQNAIPHLEKLAFKFAKRNLPKARII